jgi:diaminohydroxyphosphoribosylaminopyrimidine deaminase / 5-amino-6-(5-phosphoribosylamino)uracil reductase
LTSSITSLDRQRLLEALELAENAIGLSDPNPRVGCILGFEDGTIAGKGHTQAAGGPHAEVMAVRDAQAQGISVEGATAWVTLEPCAHHGRTPPCCDALIAAKLHRVVYALDDPNPRVSGAGAARLRKAGVVAMHADSDLADRARDLNLGFFSRMERQRPWVRMKVAASLDGATALRDGRSQWITQEAARLDGHRWRRRAGAIITGIGTVLADDPRMDVRVGATAHQPTRIVVDSKLRTPGDARILNAPGKAVIASCTSSTARPEFSARGIQVMQFAAGANAQVDLRALLDWLGQQEVNEVHLEAGATLNAAFIEGGLVDELLLYLAPMFIGPASRPIADLAALDSLDAARRLHIVDHTMIGDDLRIRARMIPSAS